MNFMHKTKAKKEVLAFKIDLEKAYDHVNWNFLEATLQDFGFPSMVIRLVICCVHSSNIFILWNECKLDGFFPTRGLRQGDLISPYLFVLCMEKFAIFINQLVPENKWIPIHLSRDGLGISHLFFTNDVLLFCKGKNSQVCIVIEALQRFCDALGLKVNFDKSRAMCSKNILRRRRDHFTNISFIRFASSLGKYLEFPLIQGRVSKVHFADLMEKIKNQLASWKGRLLNKASRICLANSFLASIPIHQMQALWFPKQICQSLDSCLRQFIWERGEGPRSLNLVN